MLCFSLAQPVCCCARSACALDGVLGERNPIVVDFDPSLAAGHAARWAGWFCGWMQIADCSAVTYLV